MTKKRSSENKRRKYKEHFSQIKEFTKKGKTNKKKRVS